MLTLEADEDLESNAAAQVVETKHGIGHIVSPGSRFVVPQTSLRFPSSHREETQQHQRRLASPGRLWEDNEEAVSEEELLLQEIRSVDEAFVRTQRPQRLRAELPSITSSDAPSPVDMDAVDQLIGYPESDLEADSDRESEPQHTYSSRGNGHSLDTPNASISQLQLPMAYETALDTHEPTMKSQRHDSGLQRGRVPALTVSNGVSPRKRKHDILYQSSSDEDDAAASGEDHEASDNDGGDESIHISLQRRQQSSSHATKPMVNRELRKSSLQVPSNAPRQEPAEATSSQRIQKGKLNQARLQQAMAKSQHAKNGTGATGLRTRKPESEVNSTGAGARVGAQSAKRDIESGFGDRSVREDIATRKPPLPTSLGQKGSKKPTTTRPTEINSSKASAQASTTPTPQGIHQAELLAAQSRPGNPMAKGNDTRFDRRGSMSTTAGPGLPNRPSQMNAVHPSTRFRAPAPNLAMDQKPSDSLSKTARDMLRAKIQSTNLKVPSHPRAATKTKGGDDDTKPSPYTLSANINGMPLTNDPPKQPTAINRVKKPIPSAPSARNIPAPPPKSSAVQDMLAEISTGGDVGSKTPARGTAGPSIKRPKAEQAVPISRSTSVVPSPDMRSNARVSMAATTLTPPLAPDKLQRARSVSKADTTGTLSMGTANLGPTGRSTTERQPRPSSISQPAVREQEKNRPGARTPENPSFAQNSSGRPQSEVVPPLRSRAPLPTSSTGFSTTPARLSRSNAQPTLDVPSQSDPTTASTAPPTPIRKPVLPSSLAKAPSVQEKAPLPPSSTTINAHTNKHAPTPPNPAPTQPPPAKPRSKAHVRVPSGPSDFDIFVPPVPGVSEPASGGASSPTARLASSAESPRPRNVAGQDGSMVAKDGEPVAITSKGIISGIASTDRVKHVGEYGAGARNGHKNGGKGKDAMGDDDDAAAAPVFAKQDVSANNIEPARKHTPKTDTLLPPHTDVSSGPAQADEFGDREKATAVPILKEKSHTPVPGSNDEGKKTAVSTTTTHTPTKLPTDKRSKTLHEHDPTKQNTLPIQHESQAVPTENAKRASHSRDTAILPTARIQNHTRPVHKALEVVQDLSTLVSKERAKTLSSLEPYFSYRVKQKIWPESGAEGDATTTQLGFSSTVLETANRHAEEVFTQIKHQYTSTFPVHHQESTSSHNDDGCLEMEGTLASIEWPVKRVFVKIWVERGIVPSEVVAFNPPEQHTPYLSKTLYMLRLFKLIKDPQADGDASLEEGEAQEEPDQDAVHMDGASSSDSAEDSEPEADNDPDKGKHNKKRQAKKALGGSPRPKRRKIAAASARQRQRHGKAQATPPPKGFIRQHHEMACPQVYTTLFAANNAACNLQIEMISDKTLLGKAQQEELNARLRKKMVELGSKEEEERYWHSEFPVGFGCSKFELVVEEVSLCGPRNV